MLEHRQAGPHSGRRSESVWIIPRQADFPSAQALLEIAAVFVQSGEGRLEHYSSAVEELDGADPLDGEPLDPPPLVGGDMGIQQLLQRCLLRTR